jgi:hypothetical protein
MMVFYPFSQSLAPAVGVARTSVYWQRTCFGRFRTASAPPGATSKYFAFLGVVGSTESLPRAKIALSAKTPSQNANTGVPMDFLNLHPSERPNA